MKPSRILPLLWLIVTAGVALAASQNWYELIAPIPGLKKIVVNGIESFPLLATIPWLALLCLALIWYLGTIGKLLVAILTALLSLAGAAQILLVQINLEVLVNKFEKRTGMTETIQYISKHTSNLGASYLTSALLVTLSLVAVITVLNIKSFPIRNRQTRNSRNSDSNSPDTDLWESQNH